MVRAYILIRTSLVILIKTATNVSVISGHKGSYNKKT